MSFWGSEGRCKRKELVSEDIEKSEAAFSSFLRYGIKNNTRHIFYRGRINKIAVSALKQPIKLAAELGVEPVP